VHALQLANFWQDVSRDLEKGRIYIPLDAAAAHGLSERHSRTALRRSLRSPDEGTYRAHSRLFAEGSPLAKMVDGHLSVDLEMFTRGGLVVLDAIERRIRHSPPSPSHQQRETSASLWRSLLAYLIGLDRKSEKSKRIPVTLRAEQALPKRG